ncbi:MAG: alanine racemase [Armatimonadetes bacterium]|nr:alanine racemase [Armatimonadota bacterium]
MNTYVAVNVDALTHNVRQVLGALAPGSRLMAVVKANGYGHDLVLAARTFTGAGASWLGVSTVAEGVSLREAGLAVPVLVLVPPLGADELESLVQHRLIATIVAVSQLHDLAQASRAQGRRVECHVYVDSGLGRLGSNDSLPDILDAVRAFPALSITGIYTHVGPPGSGEMLPQLEALRQGGAVKGFAALTREAARHYTGQRPLVHLAASRLFLQQPESHLDMVRLGTLLYGQYPDDCRERSLQLREDTFALTSRIISVHTLPPGARVGYGGEFVCHRETRVATVPVGTAHGLELVPWSVASRPRTALKAWLARHESRRGRTRYAPRAALAGRSVPLVGRVSMDQCCLDVTDVPEAAVGDAVVLPVRRLVVPSAIPRVPVSDRSEG